MDIEFENIPLDFKDIPIEKKDNIKKYNLPRKVVFCKKCVIPNQRPRITFDKDGVCTACRFAEYKAKGIDWEKREIELIKLLDKHRSKDGSYDVIVPCSGGKDSSRVAYELKNNYGMHPLTVTWAPHMHTDVGWKNFQNFIHSGFNNVLGTPNGLVHRIMTRLSFEILGDPFQPFIYGAKSFPITIATRFKIPLIMYGEDGEVEYGGDKKIVDRSGHNITNDMEKHYFSGLGPEFWMKYGIKEEDILPYKIPPINEIKRAGVECRFWGYYKKWTPQENYYFSSEKTRFTANPYGRSEGTYSKYASLDDQTDGFHFYLSYIKFGIGRATADAAHEIRDGHITREEGVRLVRKFDGEFPKKYFKTFLKYIGITEEHFWKVVESFREGSPHLWEKRNGEWILKHQVS